MEEMAGGTFTISNGGVFGHKLPELQVLLPIVIEKVKQPIDGLLEQYSRYAMDLRCRIKFQEIEVSEIFAFLICDGIEFLFDFVEDQGWKFINEGVDSLRRQR